MNKGVTIRFAEKKDEKALQKIMAEYGMGVPGEIEDQLIIDKDGRVTAGSKLIQYAEDHFFLEVLGVNKEIKGQGYGGMLLGEITRDPWKCCKNPISKPDGLDSTLITTIARGEAEGFYEKYGFRSCYFSQIPEPYRQQCAECPDQEECRPLPMMYKWRFE